MLGQLDEADQEQVELRLLSDPAFCEEFDVVVDEISIRYAAGGFEGDQKDRVERYFLRAPERQNKVRVMSELLHYSAATRGQQPEASPVSTAVERDSSWFARMRRFWNSQPLTFRFATTVAVLVIVDGAGLRFRSARRAADWLDLTAEQEQEMRRALREYRPFELDSPAVLVTRLITTLSARPER